jgi:uncharacterized protein (DUF1501 family)
MPSLPRAQRCGAGGLRVTTDLRNAFKGVLADHLRTPGAVIEQTVFPGSAAVRAVPLLRA